MSTSTTSTIASAFSFRKAEKSDIPDLVALMQDTVAAMIESGNDQWDDTYPNVEVITKDIEAQTLEVLCFREDNATAGPGRIAGCVTVDRYVTPLWAGMDWTFPDDQITAVHRLMVHPSQQGKGLARLIMQHVETVALQEHHTRCIRLDTYCKNVAAHALYPRLGYRHTGTATMRKGLYSCFEKALSDAHPQ